MKKKGFIDLPLWILGWYVDGDNKEEAVKFLSEKGLMVEGKLTEEGHKVFSKNIRIRRREQKKSWFDAASRKVGKLSQSARLGDFEAKSELWNFLDTCEMYYARLGRESRLSQEDKRVVGKKIKKIAASYKQYPAEALCSLLYSFQYDLGQSQYDEINDYAFVEVGKRVVARYCYEQNQNIKFGSKDSMIEDVIVCMSEYATEKLLKLNQKKLLEFFKTEKSTT